MIKYVLKCVSFLCVFFVLFLNINYLMTPMLDNKLNWRVTDEPEDTIDLIFFGSSLFFCNINPNVIWEESGVSAYVAGSSVQTLDVSYYYLREALKKQSPKVVVIDAFSLVRPPSRTYEDRAVYDEIPENYLQLSLDAMDFSENKVAMAEDLKKPDSSVLGYLLGTPVYHSQWSNLTEDTVMYNRKEHSNNRWKGFSISQYGLIQPQPPWPDIEYPTTDEREEMLPRYMEYFNRILQLSKTEGFHLMVMYVPDTMLYESPEIQAKLNTLYDMAEQGEFDVVDFTRDIERIGFDFETDFWDRVHMNGKGADVFSKYLIHTFQQFYDLPDHRGDPVYSSWDMALAEYKSYAESQQHVFDGEPE